MDLFTLVGKISIESADALSAIDKVLKSVQSLYNYINNNSGTINVNTSTSSTDVGKVWQEVRRLYDYINNNKGTTNIESGTSLSAIGKVSNEVKNLYSYINNNSGTININTSAAEADIARLNAAASGVSGYLTSGLLGLLPGNTSSTKWVIGIKQGVDKTVSKSINALDVAMGNLLTHTVLKGVSAGTSFMQTGYEYNTFVEKQIAHFQTLMQTTKEDATAFFGEIEQFALDTPLSLEGVVEMATKLLGVGVEPDAIIETLQMLGDISLGDTTRMFRLAKALTDVQANTTFLAQEGRQTTEIGVPIWQMLSEYYAATDGTYSGYSAADLKAMDKKEFPISYEDYLGALQMSVAPGGMFYGAMEVAMNTTEGQAERMTDNYRRTAGEVTKMFVDIFTSETIPAMNNILQLLNEWATENPEALATLAKSFSDFATNGIEVLLTALTKLVEYYDANMQKIAMLLAVFGTVAMFSGNPTLGAGMITMSRIAMGINAENELEEGLSETKENGTWTVASAVMPDEVEAQLNAGVKPSDLSDEDQKKYDLAKATMETLGYIDAAYESMSMWPDLANLATPQELAERIGLPLEPQQQETGTSESSELTVWDRIKLAWDAIWGGDEAETQFHNRQDVDFEGGSEDGIGGSNGIVGTLAAIQSTLASLPAEVQSAASAGVAEGVGGITVTGTITTGNVTLSSGAIIGELAPALDLKLGALNQFAGR